MKTTRPNPCNSASINIQGIWRSIFERTCKTGWHILFLPVEYYQVHTNRGHPRRWKIQIVRPRIIIFVVPWNYLYIPQDNHIWKMKKQHFFFFCWPCLEMRMFTVSQQNVSSIKFEIAVSNHHVVLKNVTIIDWIKPLTVFLRSDAENL